MRDTSLRLPYVAYLCVGSVLLGVLVAPAFRDVPAADPAGIMGGAPAARQGMAADMPADMAHPTREVPAEGAPGLSLSVEKDPMDGWNLSLATRNFTFTPEQAGGPATPNTGHAHLYVDGVKVARLYGPHHHLPDMAPGRREIMVVLSANDHAYYTVDGARVAARAEVLQRPPAAQTD